jgi:phage gp46-like protein
VAGALRQPSTDAVNRLLDAARVQQLFVNASSLAKQKLVNVLENKTGAGSRRATEWSRSTSAGS